MLILLPVGAALAGALYAVTRRNWYGAGWAVCAAVWAFNWGQAEMRERYVMGIDFARKAGAVSVAIGRIGPDGRVTMIPTAEFYRPAVLDAQRGPDGVWEVDPINS